MFVDQVLLELRAGKGGNGIVAWRKEKYLPKGGPYGGNGGLGGSIIIESVSDMYSLEAYRNVRFLKADDGQAGGSNNRTGRNGKNLIVKVPEGTLLKDAETKEVIYDFVGAHEVYTVCKGGKGGKGNTFFKTATNRAPTQCTLGKPGEIRQVELELKLIADIGLVGFPNAGKSTLFNTLAQAEVKIGAYPFTTLHPALGLIHHSDTNSLYCKPWVIADIPGIIKGASENKGLGLDFLKHIERTRVLLFVVDVSQIERQAPEEDLQILMDELLRYKQDIADKSMLIALNKIDNLLPDEQDACLQKFQNLFPNQHFTLTSGLTGEGINALHDFFKQRLIK